LNILELGGPRAAWALGVAAIFPFVAGTLGVWFPPAFVPTSFWPWTLCLYTAMILSLMGWLRLRIRVFGPDRVSLAVLVLAALPPLIALIGCALAPLVGFRWAMALSIAALSVQSGWDFKGESLPVQVRRVRRIVSAGALVSLMLGFVGSS
jgi:hypothetical protein